MENRKLADDRWVNVELLNQNGAVVARGGPLDPSGSYSIGINSNATTTKIYRVSVYGGNSTGPSIGPEAVSGWFTITPPVATSTTPIIATTTPILRNASSPVFQGRNLVITGLGFSATGNIVRLTNISDKSKIYFINNLPGSNNGTNLSFNIATSTAPGRYYTAVKAVGSDWSDSGKMVAQTIVEIKAPIGSASSEASVVGGDNSEARAQAATLLRRLEDIRDRINALP